MFVIDTDNAFGSPKGDVDDAYAIAAMIRGGAEIAAISAVGGNTSEPLSHQNNLRLAHVLRWTGPVLRAAEARPMLRTFPGRILALGPLTNVALATAASEIIIVGSKLRTWGRWPGLWPHEFNLTEDKAATRKVFASAMSLTFFPLDVVRALSIRRRDLEDIAGAFGEELRRGSARWFRHRLLKRASFRFPLWDLVAALYALDPDGLTIEDTTATMRASTLIEFGKGSRKVRVCTSLDAKKLWKRFVRLVSDQPAMRL